jgi:hypothetical protein
VWTVAFPGLLYNPDRLSEGQTKAEIPFIRYDHSLLCHLRLLQRGTIRLNSLSTWTGSRRRSSLTTFRAAIRLPESS